MPQKSFSGIEPPLGIMDSYKKAQNAQNYLEQEKRVSISQKSDFFTLPNVFSFFVALKRENPVITDWVHSSGGSTEGTLGRWLAQRQAALRGCRRRVHGQPSRLFRVVPRIY